MRGGNVASVSRNRWLIVSCDVEVSAGFSIRRLAFWLSAAGTVYFIGAWDVVGMAISGAVFVLTLISKLISMDKETDDSDDQN